MSSPPVPGNDQVVTESGRIVPELKIDASHFIDQVCVLYGPTKTGKTYIVKTIMKLLVTLIDQVIVVSPTEPMNHSYQGIVPQALMHYRVWMPDPAAKQGKKVKADDAKKGAERFLDNIWKRQEMAAANYAAANNKIALVSLFNRLPEKWRMEGVRIINMLNGKRRGVIAKVRAKYRADEGQCEEKVKEVNDKFGAMLVLIYKMRIAPHVEHLIDGGGLGKAEKDCLRHIKLNPRMLLIFDDCAAELKPLFKSVLFRKIFYQGRHVFITCIVCCQDDTDVPPELRKNARIVGYTSPAVASVTFSRANNGFTKETAAFVREAIPAVFQGHRKLVYIREDDTARNFYTLKVPVPRAFEFGSPALRELCGAVEPSGVTLDKENPYYSVYAQ